MKRTIFLLITAFQCFTFKAQADTVVGIHGFLTNAHTMRPIKSVLQCCGFDVCLWDYPSRRRYIEEHAHMLVGTLNQIACQCPGKPIHFVAHSIGALVLRSAVNLPSCPQEARIGRTVLLAPPNQGSELARRFSHVTPISFALGDRSGWELMHYEPSQIPCYFGEFPASMQVLVIAGSKGNKLLFEGPNDGYLTVEETWLNTPYCYQCFPFTHGELLTEPQVLATVRDFLLGSEPAVADSDIN